MPVIPALWEAEEARPWGQEFKTSLANMVKPRLYQKYKNYLGIVACACSPIYQEAEAEELLEPRRWRLQVAVSWEGATALQPTQQSETPSQNKQTNKQKGALNLFNSFFILI